MGNKAARKYRTPEEQRRADNEAQWRKPLREPIEYRRSNVDMGWGHEP